MLTYPHRGFSLVELMVAIGLFAFVMSISMGAYLVMINVSREAQAQTTGINNLSYALESMTRAVRTGTKYVGNGTGNPLATANDCSPCTSIQVTNPDNSISWFGFTESGGKGYITEDGVILTDPLVDVDRLEFHVTGSYRRSANGDENAPHVTFVIKGKVMGAGKQERPFYVQTGATMRGIDL